MELFKATLAVITCILYGQCIGSAFRSRNKKVYLSTLIKNYIYNLCFIKVTENMSRVEIYTRTGEIRDRVLDMVAKERIKYDEIRKEIWDAFVKECHDKILINENECIIYYKKNMIKILEIYDKHAKEYTDRENENNNVSD